MPLQNSKKMECARILRAVAVRLQRGGFDYALVISLMLEAIAEGTAPADRYEDNFWRGYLLRDAAGGPMEDAPRIRRKAAPVPPPL